MTSQTASQNPDARKAEAARLLEQGNKQHEAGNLQTALQSYEQARNIYLEIGDRDGELEVLRKIREVLLEIVEASTETKGTVGTRGNGDPQGG